MLKDILLTKSQKKLPKQNLLKKVFSSLPSGSRRVCASGGYLRSHFGFSLPPAISSYHFHLIIVRDDITIVAISSYHCHCHCSSSYAFSLPLLIIVCCEITIVAISSYHFAIAIIDHRMQQFTIVFTMIKISFLKPSLPLCAEDRLFVNAWEKS